MYGYIYLITDTTNGKQYVGQHRYNKPELDPTYHGSGKIIKRIYAKRPETLIEELLFIAATYEELNYFENYFIERLNTIYPNGYNLCTGGNQPIYTEIAKEKNRIAHLGQPAWNRGVPQTEETRRKMSESKKGKYTLENSSKWNDNITEEDLYREYIINGHTLNECAEIFNTSKGCIERRCSIYDIRKSPDIDEDRLYEEYIVNKQSERQLEKLFKCSRKKISRILVKHGLKK